MGDRWDRDRVVYERDRDYERDREFGRGRDFEQDRYEDDRYYMRGGRSDRGRDRSDERHDRRYGRGYEDDYVVRDRRYYEDDRYGPRREPASATATEYDRRVVIDKETERDTYRDSRPAFLRRQSSLDTHDRRPLRRFYEREEYPPPARREDVRRDDAYREDYRAPPYQPIPLPRAKGLPPPGRRYEEADEEFRAAYPERVHEREIIREKRDSSRESRATRARTHKSSRSSSSSSRTGSASARSEYPKKGKTRIPARLLSKRALYDLEYPYVEEGNTVIVQKALGQDNIDELLKLSEDYNKAEAEVAAARSAAGTVVEERRGDIREEIVIPPPPAPAQVVVEPPPAAPAPIIVDAGAPREVEVDRTVIRDVSPTRTAYSGHRHHHHHYEDDGGAVVAIERQRSRSRSGRDIRHEIRALERELAHRPKVEYSDREIVRTERLPDGQLVVYEEEVEREVAAHKPPRIEKDKKGRMSISVPKYR